ncbi:MAG: hypothetical protein HWE22_07970 [Flavobacteriales bacterium]|nr:hypothetical protein [Flavobacteriales bacterium]
MEALRSVLAKAQLQEGGGELLGSVNEIRSIGNPVSMSMDFIENGKTLVTGTDFNGEEASRTAAGVSIGLEALPFLKFGKYAPKVYSSFSKMGSTFSDVSSTLNRFSRLGGSNSNNFVRNGFSMCNISQRIIGIRYCPFLLMP